MGGGRPEEGVKNRTSTALVYVALEAAYFRSVVQIPEVGSTRRMCVLQAQMIAKIVSASVRRSGSQRIGHMARAIGEV